METVLGLVVFAVVCYFIYKQWNKDEVSNGEVVETPTDNQEDQSNRN